MAKANHDVVVVGAGIMGSASAFYASKKGSTLLVDQFAFLHRKGSSHGESRIFRLAYPDEAHSRLCLRSKGLWAEAEKLAGEQVLTYTGELDIGSASSSVTQVLETLKSLGIQHEQLSAADVDTRFPGVDLGKDMLAVYSPDAGMVDATGACRMFQRLAKEAGAELREGVKIVSVDEIQGDQGETVVRIKSDAGEEFFAKKVIITAGAWASKLLQQNLPLETTCLKTAVAYWRCERPEEYDHSRFPVFINYDRPHVYGLPVRESAGLLKVCSHDGPACDPDTRGAEPDEEGMEIVKAFIKRHLRRVDASGPARAETCQYTMTTDGLMIIDRIPATPSIVVGAGFCGHGFKMAPAIGKALADLALDGTTEVEIAPFSLSRPTLGAK